MTRIIGGSAKGRRLKTPTGDRTRPTSDRVREAMFSSLESENGSMVGLRFLDLYAGSGGVGLEALSRGASGATLVESDRRTAALIRDNASVLGFAAEVLTSTVASASVRPPAAAYDVAFLDPPYSLDGKRVGATLRTLHHNGWLATDAVVIVERSSRDQPFTWPEGILPERSRRYGETTLWYGRASGPTKDG